MLIIKALIYKETSEVKALSLASGSHEKEFSWMQTLLWLLFPLKLEVKSHCCFWDQIFLLHRSHYKLVEGSLQNSGWCEDQFPAHHPRILLRNLSSHLTFLLLSKIGNTQFIFRFTVKMMNTIKIFQNSRKYEHFGHLLYEFFMWVFYVSFISQFYTWIYLCECSLQPSEAGRLLTEIQKLPCNTNKQLYFRYCQNPPC